MFKFNYCAVLLFIWSVSLVSCWRYYDHLNFLRTKDNGTVEHTEFIYGRCKKDPNDPIVLYQHIHLSDADTHMKAIARGWLNIPRVPTCVKVRGTSHKEDMFRSTAYKFQMCTPVVTFIYNQYRFRYFYYEWFLPDEVLPGVEWDLYFYGPPYVEWGYPENYYGTK